MHQVLLRRGGVAAPSGAAAVSSPGAFAATRSATAARAAVAVSASRWQAASSSSSSSSSLATSSSAAAVATSSSAAASIAASAAPAAAATSRLSGALVAAACLRRGLRSSSPAFSAPPRRSLSATAAVASEEAAAAAEEEEEAESLRTDVLIVGGGPAGLAAAIRVKQLSPETEVLLIEKAGELGAHTLSGAVLEPRALDELLPGWRDGEFGEHPLRTPAASDSMKWLPSATGSVPLPVVPALHNEGNFIVSLGQVVRWLGEQAEALGVDVYPGFAGSRVLYHEDGKTIKGVRTVDQGLEKDGSRGPNFAPGMELHGRVTLFAEGARGSLTKTLYQRHPEIRADCEDQTFGIGIKEVWEIPKEKHSAGTIQHTIGYPLDHQTYGGSFLYHLDDDKIAIGFVVGLDYKNPYFNPYKEFQRLKHHPEIAKHLEGGRCIEYGARVINEGGIQSIPHLEFPGGALIGCTAGFVNVAKIKGTHTAMKTGMLAAETAVAELEKRPLTDEEVESESVVPLTMEGYESQVKSSWVWEELYASRNIRPAFQKGGLILGSLYAGLDLLFLRGRAPFTLSHGHADHESLDKAADSTPIDYPKPDGKLSFDLLENLQRSNTNHEESNPPHLKLSNEDAIKHNLPLYDNPETRFCPAGVYEIVDDDSVPEGKRLQINAQNCLHCKTCDVKDDKVTWTTPTQTGGGPAYSYS